MEIDLDPVEHITTDAVGLPGERTFYLQARRGTQLVTILLEKQQVQLLAASVVEILSRIGKETGEGPGEASMSLEEPLLPEWRAGRLSIGYEEDRDLILLEVDELLPEEADDEDAQPEIEEIAPGLALGPEIRFDIEPETEEENGGTEDDDEETVAEALAALEEIEASEDEGEGEEPRRARFWATREQMLSLARHGAAVCAQGRPLCRLCGNPIGPEGHVCPALNGHGGTSGG